MTLEDRIIEHLHGCWGSYAISSQEIADTLWGRRDDPLVGIIMEVDDFIIPYLASTEGKVQALTSPMPMIRKRAKKLLEDPEDYEFTLALHWARNPRKKKEANGT